MFERFFCKNPHRKLDVPASEITYRGNVEGSGVNAIRLELTTRASEFSAIHNAWLARIQHASEDKIRIMLLIESPASSPENRSEMASACTGVIPLDIVFVDSMPEEFVNQIKRQVRPLFLEKTHLYHCPMVVEPGSNVEAPSDWIGAIVNLYVADTDHESALRRAAAEIEDDGYVLTGLHDDRVVQLDPEKWWDGHVLAVWPEHAAHLPSQAEIRFVLRCGGIVSGPVLGWSTDTRPRD